MSKKPNFITSLLVSAYALTATAYAIEYTNTSFYVNYDSEDPVQYALVMPSVNKVYTHKAGEIQSSDLTQVDGELASFPTYTNGELCFPALKTGATGIGGSSKMAGNCYDVHYFYVQKEVITAGAAFMLYYDVKEKVQEGLAGKSETFETVKEGDTITNANSITDEDYTYFTFDHASAMVSIDKSDKDVDKVPPAIILLGSESVTVNQDATYTDAGATASDTVDGSVTVTKTGSVDTSKVGTYTITYTATDAAGNTSTKTRTVVVKDVTKPVIRLNGDVNVTITQGETYIDAGATATDNVDSDVKVSIDTSAVNTSIVGEYTVTYTASDSAGNEVSQTRTVVVELPNDTEAPEITLSGANPLEIVQGDTFVDPGATAKDNRDGDVSVIPSGEVEMSKEGEYTITYTAIDTAGNKAEVARIVKVIFNGVVHEISSVKEFRKALEDAAANGVNDAIELSKGIYNIDSDGKGTFTFTDQEDFNLTIRAANGLGHEDVILDGNSTGQVFKYQNTSVNTSLTLKGITIINAIETGVYSERNTIIEDCNISGNGYRGLSSYGNTIVRKSLFSKNLGGGLFSNGTTNIENSSFLDNNHSKASGAGFFSGGNVILKNSVLKNNKVLKSKESGGGFYTNGVVTVEDVNFTENYAEGNGGGFVSSASRYSGISTISNANFNNNRTGITYYNKGGGFLVDAAIVKNSNFIGGLSQYGGAFVAECAADVYKSNFIDNNATKRGGAIETSLGYDSCSAVLVNILMYNNSSPYGAALYTADKYYITNSSFVGNNQTYTTEEGGYAIKTKGVFINNIFSGNYMDILITDDSKVYNNYIDYSKITTSANVLKKNNLDPSSVGEVYLEDDHVTLTIDSPVINQGLNPSSSGFKDIINNENIYNSLVDALLVDIHDNSRVINEFIDIGASEYQGK